MKFSLVLFFLLSSFLPLIGQADFQSGKYTTLSGSTIKGVFNLSKIDKNQLLFKSKSEDKPILLHPEEVKSVTLRNGVSIISFHYLNIKNDNHLWLMPLTKGAVQLYKGVDTEKNLIYFLSSDENPSLKKINPHSTAEMLKFYFSDCQEEFENRVQHNGKSLQKAVLFYANCSFPNKKTEKVKSTLLNHKLWVGVQLSSFFVHTNDANIFRGEGSGKTLQPGFGVLGQHNFTKNLYFNLGLSYVDKSTPSGIATKEYTVSDLTYLSGNPYPGEATVSYHAQNGLNLKFLQIPFIFNYQLFNHKKINPFLNFTAAIDLPLNASLVDHYSTPDNISYSITPEEEIDPNQPIYYVNKNLRTGPKWLKFGLGLGLRIKQKSGNEINFMVRGWRVKESYRYSYRIDRDPSKPNSVNENWLLYPNRQVDYFTFDLGLSYFFQLTKQ